MKISSANGPDFRLCRHHVEIEVRQAILRVGSALPTRLIDGKQAELDVIFGRLVKLKTKSRDAAVRSTVAMFQFTEPIDDEAASKILEDLRKRGLVSIDPGGKLEFSQRSV